MIVRDMTVRRHSKPATVYGYAKVPSLHAPVESPESPLPTPVDPWPDAPLAFSWGSLLPPM